MPLNKQCRYHQSRLAGNSQTDPSPSTLSPSEGERENCWQSLCAGRFMERGLAASQFPRLTFALFGIAWLAVGSPRIQASSALSVTNTFLDRPLSLADAVNLALRQSPAILRAQKD